VEAAILDGICTDCNVVRLNAQYLYQLFGRPLTVLHNATRGLIPNLAACAAGKEWDHVTESAAIAFPHIYAALKDQRCERLILLGHSQGTILSAVILELLKGLQPPLHPRWAEEPEVAPERTVARKLARRWNFERSVSAAKMGKDPQADKLASFEWPGYGQRQPEAMTPKEWLKLEIYCFANCASELAQIKCFAAFSMTARFFHTFNGLRGWVRDYSFSGLKPCRGVIAARSVGRPYRARFGKPSPVPGRWPGLCQAAPLGLRDYRQ
jgi:hypothetical protein